MDTVVENVHHECDYLRSIERAFVIQAVFYTFLTGAACLKHEGFREEREWRGIYTPKLRGSDLMKNSIEVVEGVPQVVYKLPLDVTVAPVLADLDLARIFDRLIIGPSSYPWVMYDAFVAALTDAGCQDAAKRVWNSGIPVRQI